MRGMRLIRRSCNEWLRRFCMKNLADEKNGLVVEAVVVSGGKFGRILCDNKGERLIELEKGFIKIGEERKRDMNTSKHNMYTIKQ